MLFGNVVVGEVHPQPHISVFGNRKKMIFIGGTHQFSLLRHWFGEHRFGNAASRGDFLLTVEHGSWSHAPLLHCSREHFFFEKPVQLIYFTRTVHVNVNF